jgi:hypothetical protein
MGGCACLIAGDFNSPLQLAFCGLIGGLEAWAAPACPRLLIGQLARKALRGGSVAEAEQSCMVAADHAADAASIDLGAAAAASVPGAGGQAVTPAPRSAKRLKPPRWSPAGVKAEIRVANAVMLLNRGELPLCAPNQCRNSPWQALRLHSTCPVDLGGSPQNLNSADVAGQGYPERPSLPINDIGTAPAAPLPLPHHDLHRPAGAPAPGGRPLDRWRLCPGAGTDRCRRVPGHHVGVYVQPVL